MFFPSFMKEPLLLAFHKAAQWNAAWYGREYKYVFLLGHMRSGSTLLSHILASHCDFVGAGETHLNYHAPTDLPNLIPRTCQLLRKIRLPGTYIVDQINHPCVSDDVLRSPSLHKCIILLREPKATLKSLIATFTWEPATALECYVGRLAQISNYGRILGDRAMLVEYEDLVDRTHETLLGLTQFFGLSAPFLANYATHTATGKVGDPSNNIATGRIMRTRAHEIEIDGATLAAASRAFVKCRRQLVSAGVRVRMFDSRSDLQTRTRHETLNPAIE